MLTVREPPIDRLHSKSCKKNDHHPLSPLADFTTLIYNRWRRFAITRAAKRRNRWTADQVVVRWCDWRPFYARTSRP